MSSGVKKLYEPKEDKPLDEETFDWVQLRRELNSDKDGVQFMETPKEKLIRKMKENPFVPIGVGMTTFFLTAGLVSFLRRNSSQSQMMMRGRVAAQAFTICALVGGAMTSFKNKVSR
ncbi:hypothetical protein TCAL_05584 [Tigriopus californicus]|uniref:HIG1 domain-containing protein n=1 Tax=Tigriopus californicus TaxID=6832 RepID=A0A553NDT4_TIGCA|nr:HIG1 domain family member 2A, mitochondrial-like [Tigriopus californicus]TRY63597.1 hypothetical protein TCAL_05584 [Tigriopus californicus]